MRALDIGDFKEDVGAALARASSGEVVTLTQEGQPVAELGPVRMSTYQQLLGTINTMEMVLVTSDYWNAVHGADKGEAVQDIEGVEVIEKLGRNIAWMLKVIDKAGIEPPESHPRTMMNFIR